MRARGCTLCFLALVALGAAACEIDEEDDQTPGSAQLRVAHAAPNAGNLDFYLQDATRPFLRNVPYGTTTLFVRVAPSNGQIQVRPAGEPVSSPPLFTTSGFGTLENAEYTLIAAGNSASTDPADAFRLLTLNDDFDDPSSGMARVRVVNAGTNAPTLDLDVQGDNDVEVLGLPRFAATPSSGFDVPAGEELPLTVSSGMQALTAFTAPRSGVSTTTYWITTGLLDQLPRQPTAFSLLSLQTDGISALTPQHPFVYLFNALPDAGAVDVFVGSSEVVGELEFGELGVAQFAPGTYTLDFFPAQPGVSPRPDTAPLGSATTPELSAGQQLLAVATGELSAAPPTFGLVTIVEQFSLDDPENALISAINAAIDSPPLDVGVLQGPGEMAEPPLVTGLSYAEIAEPSGVSLPPDENELGLAETGSTEAEATFALDAQPGARAFLITAGRFDGDMDSVQVFVVDTTVQPWTAMRAPAQSK